MWWEYFRLSALSAEELIDERSALSGLTFVGDGGRHRKGASASVHASPSQETDLRGGEDLKSCGGRSFGKLEAISSTTARSISRSARTRADEHPEAVFAHD